MKLVVFSSDVPYPANRGGRADVWRRLLALKRLGHEVMLVHLFEATGPTAPTPQHWEAIDEVVSNRFSFPMKRGAWRTFRQLLRCYWRPWHAATRMPESSEFKVLTEKLDWFKPDLLWLEGPWFGLLVERVASDLGLPYAYRSHNVEHVYLWGQARAAVRQRDQIAWRLACVGVKRLELRLMTNARVVFDISMDDLAFWRGQGIGRQYWLPPLPELAVGTPPKDLIASEVLFVGNLGTPNNVRGVEFLVQSVWPAVLLKRPESKLTIVGSNPTAFVRDCITSAQGVELHENVPEPLRYLLGARVLVNPVMTGSGVQLKTMDMLLTNAPVITTAQGMRGLPAEMTDAVVVVQDARHFASSILEALSQVGHSEVLQQARSSAQARFSVSGLGVALYEAGIALNTDE